MRPRIFRAATRSGAVSIHVNVVPGQGDIASNDDLAAGNLGDRARVVRKSENLSITASTRSSVQVIRGSVS